MTPIRALLCRATGAVTALIAIVQVLCVVASPGPVVAADAESPAPKPTVVRRSAISAKVRGLDPMEIGDTTSSGIASNVYEGLYQYHYLKRPYQIIPCLAADMPRYSKDRLTVTIPVRKDIYFQDDACFPNGKGRQVVAEDFVYSWKRIAYKRNASKNWWILDGRIVGLDAFRDATANIAEDQMDYRQPVAGLKAIDKFTLQIKLTKPLPDLEYRMAFLSLAVVPREAVEHYGRGFRNRAVGTGPFVLKQWVRGSRIILDRNPTFRKETYPSEGAKGDKEKGLLADAGKRLPLIDRLEIQIVLEDQPYWLTFLTGGTDLAGIPRDSFAQAVGENGRLAPELARKGIRLDKFAEPATFWIGFNMNDPVLGKNLPLRQALNAAFDRRKYLQLFTNGRSIPARGVLAPGISDWDPLVKNPYAAYNPELARKKTKEAEKIHGGKLPTLELVVGGTDTTSRQMGDFYRRTFAAVGIDVKPVHATWPQAQDLIKNKKAQMYQMGWIADWPDSANFLSLWYGPNESPGPNNMNYKNAEYDKLYEQLVKMPFSKERTALARKMERMVIDDLPCLFQSHRVSYVLLQPWSKNYKPHVFGYGLAKYYNIDVKLRQQKTGR